MRQRIGALALLLLVGCRTPATSVRTAIMTAPDVTGHPTSTIDAHQAKDMILKGKIREIFESHDFGTTLWGQDGQRYHMAERIPAAWIREAEARGVSVSYAVE